MHPHDLVERTQCISTSRRKIFSADVALNLRTDRAQLHRQRTRGADRVGAGRQQLDGVFDDTHHVRRSRLLGETRHQLFEMSAALGQRRGADQRRRAFQGVEAATQALQGVPSLGSQRQPSVWRGW